MHYKKKSLTNANRKLLTYTWLVKGKLCVFKTFTFKRQQEAIYVRLAYGLWKNSYKTTLYWIFGLWNTIPMDIDTEENKV